jgi:hypothetical protein
MRAGIVRRPRPISKLASGTDSLVTRLGLCCRRLVSRTQRKVLNPGSIVLLDDVVEILRLAHLYGQTAVGLNAHNGGRVGAALVDGSIEEFSCCGVIALGSQQEIDGGAALVDRAIPVLSLASDLDVGLVHSPALSDGSLAPAERSCKHRQHFHWPAMQRGVIDENSALGHHLLDLAKAQRVGWVLLQSVDKGRSNPRLWLRQCPALRGCAAADHRLRQCARLRRWKLGQPGDELQGQR